MSILDMTTLGNSGWIGHSGPDQGKAKAFYQDVLGWTIEEMPMPDGGTYRVARLGEDMVAGIFQMDGPQFEGLPDHWVTYFAVDDVDASAKATVAAGGSLISEPFDVPGVGRFVMVRDAKGAPMGLTTPG